MTRGDLPPAARRRIRSALGLSSLTVEDQTLQHRVLWVRRSASIRSSSQLVYYPNDLMATPNQPEAWYFFTGGRRTAIRLMGKLWRKRELEHLLAGTGATVIDTTALSATYATEHLSEDEFEALTLEQMADVSEPRYADVPRRPMVKEPRMVKYAYDHTFAFMGIVLGICLGIAVVALSVGAVVMAIIR